MARDCPRLSDRLDPRCVSLVRRTAHRAAGSRTTTPESLVDVSRVRAPCLLDRVLERRVGHVAVLHDPLHPSREPPLGGAGSTAHRRGEPRHRRQLLREQNGDVRADALLPDRVLQQSLRAPSHRGIVECIVVQRFGELGVQPPRSTPRLRLSIDPRATGAPRPERATSRNWSGAPRARSATGSCPCALGTSCSLLLRCPRDVIVRGLIASRSGTRATVHARAG